MTSIGALNIEQIANCLDSKIHNLDFTDVVFAAVKKAYAQYKVLFFRKQNCTPAQHIAFSKRFEPAQTDKSPPLILITPSQCNGSKNPIIQAETVVAPGIRTHLT